MTTPTANQASKVHDRVHGRVIWVLIFTVLLQTLYPISALPNPFFPILYNLFYFCLVFAGLWLSDDRWARLALWGFGIPIIVVGALFVL